MLTIFGFDFTIWKFILLLLCAFASGFTKTGVIGLGVIITPVMASIFTAGTSLGFMIPLYILGDIVALSRFKKRVMWRPLAKALPWGIAGVLAAWYASGRIIASFGPASDGVLRNIIGGLMLTVVLLGWYVTRHPEVAMAKKRPSAPPPPLAGAEVAAGAAPSDPGTVRTWYAALLGAFAGFVSMMTNSGGPVWALYLSSLGLEVNEIIGTAIWCFFVVTLVKLPLSASLGFLDMNTLQFSLFLAPLAIAGVLVGSRFSGRFSREVFAAIIRVLALAGALYLLIF